MRIKVKSYVTMGKYTAHLEPESNLEIPEGTTVDAVLKQLSVPLESAKLIIVNGRHQTNDYVLQPGDALVFFPPVEGG